MNRRSVLIAAVGLVLIAAVAWYSARTERAAASQYTQRLLVLGFDGMDPELVRKWMAEGKLPNLKRIADQGGIYALGTTPAADSASAWASFATGVNPGKHGIYDLLERDPDTYLPGPGVVRREPGRFLFDYIQIARPRLTSSRQGTSFWVTAGRAGVRTSVLTVPMTYPPEEVPNGELLSGFPLPDLRRETASYSYFATDLPPGEEGRSESGATLTRLVIAPNTTRGDIDVARTELAGPPNPLGSAGESITIPMTVHWNRPARAATVEIGGTSVLLEPGQVSRWVDVEFRVNFFVREHGMVQLILLNAGSALQLYVSPINWKPDRPPAPMSYPSSFAGAVFDRIGPFRTLGWSIASGALDDGRIDEKTFMDDVYRAFDDRAQVILSRIDARNWDVLVGVIESPDRVQHMMWRLIDPAHPMHDAALAAAFGDAIERVYRRADLFVGEVMDHLEPGTQILVASDHGFHSWRKTVHVNAWLAEQGYLVMDGEAPDWSRTRAYAAGPGQIYLNLRGREAQGIVEPGAPATQLVAELRARLLALTDPDDGAPMVRAVYARDDLFSGPLAGEAPDLQAGMADGYRAAWEISPEAVGRGIVSPNMRKWSGAHGGFDFAATPGVLIASRPIARQLPTIMDIAPTVLAYFGIPIPADIDGKPLF